MSTLEHLALSEKAQFLSENQLAFLSCACVGYVEHDMILLNTNIQYISITYFWIRTSNFELLVFLSVYLAPLG